MVEHPFEFSWQDQRYTASFVKVASRKPIFITVHDFKPNNIGLPTLEFSIEKGDSPSGYSPQNILPIDLVNIIWKAVFQEATRIGLDINDIHTY